MAEDEAGADIPDIDEELDRIQAFLSTNPSRDESMQMLAKQASLLIAKSAVYRHHGVVDLAVKMATEAASLIDGLLSRAHQQDTMLAVDLKERWFEAHSAVGLAQVECRDLVAARRTLRFLQNQLKTARNSNVPTLYVARLEEALDAEAQERVRVFYAQAAEREAEGQLLGQDWSETHLMLDTLIEEIAERMAFASALVGRVSYPERFQEFVAQRLRGSLLKAREKPVGEVSHLEIEIRQKAEERGRRLQAIVWESDEMLRAENLRFADGSSCTDEALKPLRDGFDILGLPHPFDEKRFAYPKWQLGPRQPHVRAVMRELRTLPAWAIWHFFHQALAYLYDLSPLTLLAATDEQTREPRFAKLIEEHGGTEQALVAAAHDYVSGQD